MRPVSDELRELLTNSRSQSVITEPWEPTLYLRWTKFGVLQQRFVRKVTEFRMYGGQERRCESFEQAWCAVPKEDAEGGATCYEVEADNAVDQGGRSSGARQHEGTSTDEPGRARDRRCTSRS